jgi:tetratricopeptide (TPR) repeat protein
MLMLLLAACFSLATILQPRQNAQQNGHAQTGNVMALVLGDTRRMFANHFFAKADAYFHRGKYPSFFDQSARLEENHMAEEAGHNKNGPADQDHDEHEEGPPPPRDWIERFGRHFYPTVHVHLGGGEEREILPWLRLSAELDPHQVETYAVTAYWLGDHLGRVDEAEKFLQEGLRANPGNPELLSDLGHIYFEHRKDLVRARNLWLAALRRWHEVEGPTPDPDKHLLRDILDGLTEIALQEGRLDQAIEYLQQLKTVSPGPDAVQERINEIQRRLSTGIKSPAQ